MEAQEETENDEIQRHTGDEVERELENDAQDCKYAQTKEQRVPVLACIQNTYYRRFGESDIVYIICKYMQFFSKTS